MTDVSAADTTMLKDTTTADSNTNKYILKFQQIYFAIQTNTYRCIRHNDAQGYHHRWLKYQHQHRIDKKEDFLSLHTDQEFLLHLWVIITFKYLYKTEVEDLGEG